MHGCVRQGYWQPPYHDGERPRDRPTSSKTHDRARQEISGPYCAQLALDTRRTLHWLRENETSFELFLPKILRGSFQFCLYGLHIRLQGLPNRFDAGDQLGGAEASLSARVSGQAVAAECADGRDPGRVATPARR